MGSPQHRSSHTCVCVHVCTCVHACVCVLMLEALSEATGWEGQLTLEGSLHVTNITDTVLLVSAQYVEAMPHLENDTIAKMV